MVRPAGEQAVQQMSWENTYGDCSWANDIMDGSDYESTIYIMEQELPPGLEYDYEGPVEAEDDVEIEIDEGGDIAVDTGLIEVDIDGDDVDMGLTEVDELVNGDDVTIDEGLIEAGIDEPIVDDLLIDEALEEPLVDADVSLLI